MTRLELTPEESDLLRQALETYLSDLRMEIADTDRMDFREALKRQEVALRGVADRIAAAPGGA